MKHSLLFICLASLSAHAATGIVCEGDQDSALGPKVRITLSGTELPERPSSIAAEVTDRQSGRVLVQESYPLEQVADYQKGGAYRFEVRPQIVGIVDFFSGRGSLYVNIPTVFTGLFRQSTDCRYQ